MQRLKNKQKNLKLDPEMNWDPLHWR